MSLRDVDDSPSLRERLGMEVEERERERVRWHTAEQQVDAFVAVIIRRYGINDDEIPRLIEGLRWAAEHKSNLEQLGAKAVLTLLGVMVTGLLLALWEGLKHYLGRSGA